MFFFDITYKDWNDFEKLVQDNFPESKVVDSTKLFYPSYNIDIGEFNQTDKFNLRTTLLISVSVIAPFYTIFGRTRGIFNDKQNKIVFGTNITISPHEEYENSFIEARKLIEESFPNYTYLPPMVWGIQVNGLYVEWCTDHEASIFHALFGHVETNFKCVGDKRYEMKDWLYETRDRQV